MLVFTLIITYTWSSLDCHQRVYRHKNIIFETTRPYLWVTPTIQNTTQVAGGVVASLLNHIDMTECKQLGDLMWGDMPSGHWRKVTSDWPCRWWPFPLISSQGADGPAPERWVAGRAWSGSVFLLQEVRQDSSSSQQEILQTHFYLTPRWWQWAWPVSTWSASNMLFIWQEKSQPGGVLDVHNRPFPLPWSISLPGKWCWLLLGKQKLVKATKGWTTGCIVFGFFHILRYTKKTLTTVVRNSPQTSPLNRLESWRTGIKTRMPNRTRLYGSDLRCSCRW